MSRPDGEEMELGLRLRKAREYLGLSQEEVANVLSIRRVAITEIESGKRQVKATELQAFAKVYGISETELLNGRDDDEERSARTDFLARTFSDLSDNDLQEVARFAEFLRNRGQQGTGP